MYFKFKGEVVEDSSVWMVSHTLSTKIRGWCGDSSLPEGIREVFLERVSALTRFPGSSLIHPRKSCKFRFEYPTEGLGSVRRNIRLLIGEAWDHESPSDSKNVLHVDGARFPPKCKPIHARVARERQTSTWLGLCLDFVRVEIRANQLRIFDVRTAFVPQPKTPCECVHRMPDLLDPPENEPVNRA